MNDEEINSLKIGDIIEELLTGGRIITYVITSINMTYESFDTAYEQMHIIGMVLYNNQLYNNQFSNIGSEWIALRQHLYNAHKL